MQKIDKLLRLPQVIALTGLSKSTIYTRIKSKEFPPPIKIFNGGRAVGWSELGIFAWRESIN